jgi:hypothetical protein
MPVSADVLLSQLSHSIPMAFPILGPIPLGDASEVFNVVGQLAYVALAAVALWGAYYVFLVLTRVNAKRFKTEKAQDEFVDSVTDDLRKGNFDAVIGKCEGSKKALPMMVSYLCKHRAFGMQKARQMTLGTSSPTWTTASLGSSRSSKQHR